jgi:hypothetical protein
VTELLKAKASAMNGGLVTQFAKVSTQCDREPLLVLVLPIHVNVAAVLDYMLR